MTYDKYPRYSMGVEKWIVEVYDSLGKTITETPKIHEFQNEVDADEFIERSIKESLTSS